MQTQRICDALKSYPGIASLAYQQQVQAKLNHSYSRQTDQEYHFN